MSRSELVWSGLLEILEETTGLPPYELTAERSFEEDLGFDSLTIVEVAVIAEQRLGVAIPDDELPELRTIGDVAEFILCHGDDAGMAAAAAHS